MRKRQGKEVTLQLTCLSQEVSSTEDKVGHARLKTEKLLTKERKMHQNVPPTEPASAQQTQTELPPQESSK